jgi:hypothetical protein
MERYRCSFCDAHGVKLWRAIHDDSRAWCAKCGTAQAGLPDDIGQDGRRAGEYGTSDQIYSSDRGANLLPFVPSEDGSWTWGYSSVPDAGVRWWRALPTRL